MVHSISHSSKCSQTSILCAAGYTQIRSTLSGWLREVSHIDPIPRLTCLTIWRSAGSNWGVAPSRLRRTTAAEVMHSQYAEPAAATAAAAEAAEQPLPQPEECGDDQKKCKDWAAAGECDKNRGYMVSCCRCTAGIECAVLFPGVVLECSTRPGCTLFRRYMFSMSVYVVLA